MAARKPMKEITFRNYEPLLRRLAFKFYQRLEGARVIGVDLDEVMGHLSETFVRASRTYDPASGYVFSTYLTTACQQNFNHYAARLIKEQYGVEREFDVDNRTTTTRGLGYCGVELMSNDGDGIVNLYDVTEGDTYASPEESLHAKQVVAGLIADRTLSPNARVYLMSVINPEMPMSDAVRAQLRANQSAIRKELGARFGADVVASLRIGSKPEACAAP